MYLFGYSPIGVPLPHDGETFDSITEVFETISSLDELIDHGGSNCLRLSTDGRYRLIIDTPIGQYVLDNDWTEEAKACRWKGGPVPTA
jgi:hypothetical protein